MNRIDSFLYFNIPCFSFYKCSLVFEEDKSLNIKLRVRLAPWNQFKPSSKIFLLTIPRRCFLCGSFMLFLSCFCYMLSWASVYWCLVVTCWERADLSFVKSNCEVVTFPLVSWVRCGAWLYRFLIFALFLTFKRDCTALCILHVYIRGCR